MRRSILRGNFRKMLAAAAILLPSGAANAQVPCLPGSTVLCVDQGSKWTNATRKSFYSRDQGSQMIPYAWMQALKTPEGQPFMFDSLARYGYLKDPFRSNGLPVGFTLKGIGQNAQLGLTCAACHTRDLTRGGLTFRIDGGPAVSDFQGLLTDMVGAVGQVLSDDAEWTSFSRAVLGSRASASQIATLRTQVEIWFEREDTLKRLGYGTPDMWGLGRLDAVAMIFNRLTGLDLGPPPTYIIAKNIQPADAPVRYPFLWNAAIQDRTQWPGFSGNGTSVMGLSRNAGEVYGVFATFHPVSPSPKLGNVDFVKNNSADWWGLLALENLVKKIGTPKWPSQFPIFTDRVARGEQLYAQNCASCHAKMPGKPGFPNIPTWRTPIQDVGTDSRECQILARTADPGVMMNMNTRLFPKFKVTNPSSSFTLLTYAVLGSMVQSGAIVPAFAEDVLASLGSTKGATHGKALSMLEDSMVFQCSLEKKIYPYESRVMFGIWAAAPYLHNGSVPTLADLLEPSDKRPVTFAVGTRYDPYRLGLALTQPGNYTRTTTGCDDRNSGNSRCGHEGPGFGTDLPAADKLDLLEYLKTL